jgi:NAD(P)H-hydrate epimerase
MFIMKKFGPGQNLLMSRDEVRAFDALAINQLGVPGAVLMENAGRSCAELITGKLAGKANARVCLFCGAGNNGGDGFVIARHLLNHDISAVIALCGPREKIKGDAKINFDIVEKLGVRIEEMDLKNGEEIKSRVNTIADGADLIVDAIFGTGLSGELKYEYKRLVEAINGLKRPILAVDIPSGLDCDTGIPLGAAIKANWTVTFAAAKKGFAFETARQYTGEVFIASIGVEPKFKSAI